MRTTRTRLSRSEPSCMSPILLESSRQVKSQLRMMHEQVSPMSGLHRRRYSRLVVDGAEQSPNRAMLRAVGFTDADFTKPQIGIASTWSMVTPCNMHINELARRRRRRRARRRAEERAVQHDHGFRRHLDGHAGHALFAGFARSHRRLDRNRRGRAGLRRLRRDRRLRQEHAGLRDGAGALDRPAVFVYGGTIRPGAKRRDIVSVFEAVGRHAGGKTRRRGPRRDRAHGDSRAGLAAAACTRPTRWPRRSRRSA